MHRLEKETSVFTKWEASVKGVVAGDTGVCQLLQDEEGMIFLQTEKHDKSNVVSCCCIQLFAGVEYDVGILIQTGEVNI